MLHLKGEFMPRYAKLIYNGYWWSPEHLAMQALIDQTRELVEGKAQAFQGRVSGSWLALRAESVRFSQCGF